QPQISFAASTASVNLARSSPSVAGFPATVLRADGQAIEVNIVRRLVRARGNISRLSSTGVFELISPRTNRLLFGAKRSGTKPCCQLMWVCRTKTFFQLDDDRRRFVIRTATGNCRKLAIKNDGTFLVLHCGKSVVLNFLRRSINWLVRHDPCA